MRYSANQIGAEIWIAATMSLARHLVNRIMVRIRSLHKSNRTISVLF